MGVQSRNKRDRRRMGTPSFDRRAPLELRRVAAAESLRRSMLGPENDHLEAYHLGECSVLVTREHGRWHLSIAHPARYPHWDEIAEARYRCLPDDVVMGVLLPPRAEYINLHSNCFQMKEVRDPGLRTGSND